MTSCATMSQMALPHLNILTKCDKIQDKELLERMCLCNFEDLFDHKDGSFFNQKFKKLNMLLFDVVENFNMVQYTQSDITNENSMADLMLLIDNLVQYDEYKMPKDSAFLDN